MDDYNRFYNSSLRFLSFRPRSEKEVKDNLIKKKVSLEIIEKIISKLKEQNFLNDVEFTKFWIKQRNQFKPRSFSVIKLELRQKGINNEIIEEAQRELEDEGEYSTDFERAKLLAEKKLRLYKNLLPKDQYIKLGTMLSRKGFNFEVIKKAVKIVLENKSNES